MQRVSFPAISMLPEQEFDLIGARNATRAALFMCFLAGKRKSRLLLNGPIAKLRFAQGMVSCRAAAAALCFLQPTWSFSLQRPKLPLAAPRTRSGVPLHSSSDKVELGRQHFIRNIIEEDLASGKHKTIVTRFPPEPNGMP